MKIDTIKDLQKLIALCRKTGVQNIRVDGVELHLGAEPTKSPDLTHYVSPMERAQLSAFNPGTIPMPTPVAAVDRIATEELSYDQMLFYSSGEGTAEPGEQ